MIKRIELVNFMSHKRTVIEPSAGLTVLVGPNNCGKSAFVSALQILCHNAKSNFVLRHGEKKCEINVETNDGHTIQWSRTKSGSPKYVIDGQDFDRLKGGVPDELHEILGLAKVACEKDQYDVHFGEQKSPVFLLNDSGRASAQFFAASSDAIRLVEMQDRHKSKVRDAKRDEARLTQENHRLSQTLKTLTPIESLSEKLGELENDFSLIQKSEGDFEQAAILIKAIDEIDDQLTAHKSKSEAISPLTPPPNVVETRPLEQLIQRLSTAQKNHQLADQTAMALAPLATPPHIDDTNALIQLLDQMPSATLTWELHLKVGRTLSRITQPPTTLAENPLRKLIDRIIRSTQASQQQNQQAATLNQVSPPPQLLDQSPAETLLKQIKQQMAQVARCESTTAQIDEQISVVTAETQQWVETTPTCPTCGSETSVGQMLKPGGHQHG